MCTWKPIALVLAAALSAHADDRTGKIASGSGADTMSEHSDMSGAATATRAPELQNLTTDKFVNTAAAAGMKEVQAAELALRNSKNEQIKSFARQMVSDHTKLNSQLTTLAAKSGIQVPKELPAKDMIDIEKLRKETGATFDTAFSQQMQQDHQKAVSLFQACSNADQITTDVRKFCRDGLGTLERHSQAAVALDAPTNTSRAAAADE